jgi:hypothetical protein
LGLLYAGSGTDKAAELLAYAHETQVWHCTAVLLAAHAALLMLRLLPPSPWQPCMLERSNSPLIPLPTALPLVPAPGAWCCAVQHEKIIRGVAVGLALVHYGREEAAEGMIEQMTRELVSGTWLWHDVMPVKRTAADIGIMAQTGWPEGHAALRAAAEQHTCCWTSACLLRAACRLASPAACTHSCVLLSSLLAPPQDPILRYGGMFVTGLAYCGTSNNAAIQKLLHFAVSGACGGCSRVASRGHLPPLLHPNVDLWVAPNGSVACCNTVATVHWALLPHSANRFVCFDLCLPHHQ